MVPEFTFLWELHEPTIEVYALVRILGGEKSSAMSRNLGVCICPASQVWDRTVMHHYAECSSIAIFINIDKNTQLALCQVRQVQGKSRKARHTVTLVLALGVEFWWSGRLQRKNSRGCGRSASTEKRTDQLQGVRGRVPCWTFFFFLNSLF